MKMIKVFMLFVSIFSSSQVRTTDSLRGKFTYHLKSKPNTLFPTTFYEEEFSLQVSDDRAFFISEKVIEKDSIVDSEFSNAFSRKSDHVVIDMRNKNLPKTLSNFLIIQSQSQIQYLSSVGMSLLSYSEPSVNNWKLLDETKIINSYHCRKAALVYKGRQWIAWYTVDIPLPYGPYKFSGLPGLIVKMTDKSGDYDFELIRALSSNKLKGKVVKINKSHFYDAVDVGSRTKFLEVKKNYQDNRIAELEKMGAFLNPEQKKDLLDRERARREKDEIEKKGYNPLEFE